MNLFKILESGARRVPLVSTTLGAEGITVNDKEHILLADVPEYFVNAIISLMEDKQLTDALAENLHNLVSKMASVDTLVEEVKINLEYLNHD